MKTKAFMFDESGKESEVTVELCARCTFDVDFCACPSVPMLPIMPVTWSQINAFLFYQAGKHYAKKARPLLLTYQPIDNFINYEFDGRMHPASVVYHFSKPFDYASMPAVEVKS